MEVWVFNGARQSPSAPIGGFPSGVFSSLALAEEWIKRHRLSGVITLYRVDVGAYDWAVANGLFKPSKPHHGTPAHIGGFGGGDIHYHYESGARSD